MEKLEDCTCHSSCKACGFSDEPTGEGECVSCGDDDKLVSSWPSDLRGHCVPKASPPGCVGYEVTSWHWGEITPQEYCEMGGNGYEKGAHCARAWEMISGEEVGCDVFRHTP